MAQKWKKSIEAEKLFLFSVWAKLTQAVGS